MDVSHIALFLDRPWVFSRWYPSAFTIGNEQHDCAEQFMMSEKAYLYGDTVTRLDIIASFYPEQQENLGRSVSNFNHGLWERHRYDIVFKGNLDKLSTPSFLQQLLGTSGKLSAEAYPRDLIWGVGFRADDWQRPQSQQWRGINVLAYVFMKIRRQLYQTPLNPAPLASRPSTMVTTR